MRVFRNLSILLLVLVFITDCFHDKIALQFLSGSVVEVAEEQVVYEPNVYAIEHVLDSTQVALSRVSSEGKKEGLIADASVGSLIPNSSLANLPYEFPLVEVNGRQKITRLVGSVGLKDGKPYVKGTGARLVSVGTDVTWSHFHILGYLLATGCVFLSSFILFVKRFKSEKSC